ncbi:xanthine dehydrogenase family protein molybdopterin-binding subunit [soil metagenome]
MSAIIQKVLETVVKHTPDKPADPLIGVHGAVGSALSRVDGPLKVSGTARFTAEVPFENIAHAALVCSTIAKGRIVGIDKTAAEQAPGVILVMTHANAPKMKAPPQMFSDRKSTSTSNLPVMQDDLVHWNGQPVAIVVAESPEQADRAAALVRVQYERADAHLAFEPLLPSAKPPKNILGEPASIEVGGDAEAALAGAAVVVDQVYRTPRHNHAALELHATIAHWNGDDGLIVHDASQAVTGTQYTLAKVFGLEDDEIRVLAPFVGGAFGNKTVWDHQLLCIAAARLTKRPVRILLSREDVFRMTGGRTLTRQRVALGAKTDGTLAALIHSGHTAVTSHNAFPEQFTFPARHLYAVDSLSVAQEVVELDMVANTAMRAPGESVGTFALESAIDELALALKLDPIELRRRLEPAKDPTKDVEFSSRNLVEAYRRGAERFGWRNAPVGSQRDGEWLVGQGVATATYPYYRMAGANARIRITSDGRALVQMAAQEMGMGTATAQAQHAAERLGLPIDRVTFGYGDTDMPAGTTAGGSSQTVTIMAAVIAAHDVLVKALLDLVGKDSALHGKKPDEVVTRDGGLFLKEATDIGESYVTILDKAGRDDVVGEAAAPPPVEIMKHSMHSFGAQFCEVRVSEVTGEVRVSRWLGSFDTGRILNPKLATSQFRGGIIMGIGLALTEEALFDERSGRIMNASMAEYHVPVHLDVPEIDVIWTDIPDPHSPLGARGIGEIGITGVAAAIANAIHNATGKRIRELPITLDKVLAG